MNRGRPKKMIVEKLISDSEVKSREGTWIEETDIKHLVNCNTDVYWKDGDGQLHLLLKFRKSKIKQSLLDTGWSSYKDLAKASRGRGASAGPIDSNSDYWKKRNLVSSKKWSTGYLNPTGNDLKQHYDTMELGDIKNICIENCVVFSENDSKDDIILKLIKKHGGVSKMKVNNQVASNPIGFYEAGKNFADLPCRLTHFTRTNYEKYNTGLPFIQKIDELFHNLVPESYQKQRERADTKPHLKIPETCFSTVTINRNFRTALHRDAGDFREGFGNLTVIEQGYYHGGYTVFPQFGVGIDLRSGDFVAMDVHQWHANTPIYETPEDKLKNMDIVSDFKDNPAVGTAGLYQTYTRISFVCYLREKIASCPDEIDPRYLTKSGHNKITPIKEELKEDSNHKKESMQIYE
jgi:hypothetical protein